MSQNDQLSFILVLINIRVTSSPTFTTVKLLFYFRKSSALPGWCCKSRSAGPWEDGPWVRCGTGTQHRTSVAGPPDLFSGPCHRDLFRTPIALACLPSTRAWVSVKNKFLCFGLLRKCLGFWQTPSSFRRMTSLLNFTARCYAGFFSGPWCSTLGIPAWGWNPTLLRSDFCSWGIPRLLHMSAGASPLCIFALLTSLHVASVNPRV